MQANKKMCESCLMPLEKDPLGDKRESEIYCSYCYKDGGLVYPGNDPKEFRSEMFKAIRSRGVNAMTAHIYVFFSRFAPRWKNKK